MSAVPAIGLHQLRRADELHRKRSHWAAFNQQQLADRDEIILPQPQADRIHSWHLFPIRLRIERLRIDRGQFIQELKSRGITSGVHWLPLHMHPYYRETYGYQPGDLPEAARIYPELLTLPLYPDLSEADAVGVCAAVRTVVEQNVERVYA